MSNVQRTIDLEVYIKDKLEKDEQILIPNMCKSSICTWAQLDYIWNEMDYLVTPDVVCILHINWICIDAYSKFHSLSLRLMWMVRTLHHCSSTWNHRKEASLEMALNGTSPNFLLIKMARLLGDMLRQLLLWR